MRPAQIIARFIARHSQPRALNPHPVPPRYKLGVYLLEGFNTFACAYYGNYILFLLRDQHGFGNVQLLALGAGHGLIYVFASLFGGRFGQRHGYFTSLRVGFSGMLLAMLAAFWFPSLIGQLLAFSAWTIAMCFTWPMLEALVSEHEAPAALSHRVGLYNVVWASVSSVAFFVGGTIFETVGAGSLYLIPAVLFLVNLVATFSLQRAHDRWLVSSPSIGGSAEPVQVGSPRPRDFLRLAWIANPFSYMAANTFIAVVPGIAKNVGLTIAEAGMVMSVWFIVRAVSFVVLWAWHGWHYRFRFFITSFVLLAGSFVVLMLTREVWVLVVAQIFFGWATGLMYYSSLFYAMDGSATKGEHGGVHEAFIGLGICAGPAVGAVSLLAAPATAAAPVLAVGCLLIVGFTSLVVIRVRTGRA